MTIGFIGVGAMGGGLARNLIRANKDVVVYDLSPEAVDKALAAGETGRAAATVQDMAGCELVFTSLPMPQNLKEVMLGEDGLLARMGRGSVYIDVSTIDPGTALELEEAAREKGLGFLACPLGKTPAQAEKAEEPIFVGGDREVFERVKDTLEVIGNPVTYMGKVEASCALKLISNLIGMTNLAVLAEGIRIGQAAGIEPQLLLELLGDTGAKSFQMDVRGPWIINSDFAPRFGLNLALKDVRLGVEMARGWGNEAKTMQTCLEYLTRASESGLGSEDCNAMYKIIT